MPIYSENPFTTTFKAKKAKKKVEEATGKKGRELAKKVAKVGKPKKNVEVGSKLVRYYGGGKEWEKEYKGQIASAHKLLQKYDFSDIVNALKSTDGIKIYSLRAPHLSDIIDKTVSIRQNQPAMKTKNIERNLLNKGITKSNKNTILDKLKELDNGITG